MPVPFWSNRRELDVERGDLRAALERVLDSGRLVLGPEVDAFEREFAAACGRKRVVGVANGTDALALALRALDLPRGSGVATVANSAVATAAAIVGAGLVPRFVDVEPDSGLMDLDALERVVAAGNVACIVPVHLYGRCLDLERLASIAAASGVPVVEDCAQAVGASRGGRPAGSIGVAAAYSFYPTKNLGALGDGGAVATDDEAFAERVRGLRTYGMRGGDEAHEHGVNSRLDEIQAAWLRARLVRLDERLARRRALAEDYLRALASCAIGLPSPGVDERPGWHLFVVRHADRDRLRRELEGAGVGTLVHYPVPLHAMRAFAPFAPVAGEAGALPNTERRAREIVSLPLHPGLSDDERDRVIDAVRDAAARAGGA